ncbi:MAG TPA: hypothetical protein VK144_00635 [Bacillota bacterium]|nr:hypothetical protein [Bacillota bacterium]
MVISMPFLLFSGSIVGMYMSLAVTLVFVAAATLLIVWFIPMINELKNFIIGLVVIITAFVWIKINLFS